MKIPSSSILGAALCGDQIDLLPPLPFPVPLILSGPEAKTFLAEAYYQHANAYFSFFQVQALQELLQSSTNGKTAPVAAGGA